MKHRLIWLRTFGYIGFWIMLATIVIMFQIHKINKERLNSNRQRSIDTDNRFEVAYVKTDSNTLVEIPVRSWRDFQYDDCIQFTDTNGIVYLTQYSNVILVSSKTNLIEKVCKP